MLNDLSGPYKVSFFLVGDGLDGKVPNSWVAIVFCSILMVVEFMKIHVKFNRFLHHNQPPLRMYQHL